METVLDKKINRRSFIKRAAIGVLALAIPAKAISAVTEMIPEKKLPSLELTAKDLPSSLRSGPLTTADFTDLLKKSTNNASKELIKIKPMHKWRA